MMSAVIFAALGAIVLMAFAAVPEVSAFSTTAFIRSPPSVAYIGSSRSSVLYSSEPEKEESESGLDLDLEEMFDMFDAADNEESFDDAIKKVKGE